MAMNENMYFAARKTAAMYNESLSRERAAELIGVHPSTLADYELGLTKTVPPDKVVLMADLYNAPELKTQYCKHECPIGREMALATKQKGIEGITLRLLKEFSPDRVKDLTAELIDIAEDGIISEDEQPRMEEIIGSLDQMTEVISELKLAAVKAMRGGTK